MKRLNNLTFAAGLLTGLWLGSAHADDAKNANCPPPPGPRHGWGGPPGMMGGPHHPPLPLKEADANKDGRITRTEVDQATKARFAAADADRSGALDAKEFEAARPKPPADMPKPPEGTPPRGPFGDGPEHMFKRLDWNSDGKLSLDEFQAPIRAMAARIDRDADGVIGEDEMKGPPHRPPPG